MRGSGKRLCYRELSSSEQQVIAGYVGWWEWADSVKPSRVARSVLLSEQRLSCSKKTRHALQAVSLGRRGKRREGGREGR